MTRRNDFMIRYRYKDTSGISEEEAVERSVSLQSYREHLQEVVQGCDFSSPEASLILPEDEEAREEVVAVADNLQNDLLRYVVVVGIGGSNLGTKAIYDALGHRGAGSNPEMLFLESVDSNTFDAVCEKLCSCEREAEFSICVVSKSGKTTETIANADALFGRLSHTFEHITSRVVCITDANSPLWVLAGREGYFRLPIPEHVGGRYSVFSSVGLLPLSLCGVNTEELLEGAQEMLTCGTSDDVEENPALAGAITVHAQYTRGIPLSNLFLFNGSLQTIGDWWRQLIGESLGKEYDASGTLINAGITPLVSLGSTDLHSVGQLYFGGPRDKFTTFVSVTDAEDAPELGTETTFGTLVPELPGKNFHEIMAAILEGVKTAYREKDLPFAEVEMSDISEKNLGAFLQMKMLETMYLAVLMNVNCFDQPAVERYKEVTRTLLGKESEV